MGRVRHRTRGHDSRDGNRPRHGHVAGGSCDSSHGHRHDLGLPALPDPGGALGDDARADGWVPVLRLRGLQGQVAAVRQARERVHRLGLLARMVPGRAAQHDPGVVLHRRQVRPVDQRDHPDPHTDRLLDDHHLDHRDPARVHPGLARHPAGGDVRNRARAAVDDPAHAHRHSSAVQALVARLRQPVRLQRSSTGRRSSRPCSGTAG